MQIKTILVPTDYSEDSEAALDMAIGVAIAFGSEVEVFHAYYVDVPMIYAGFGGDYTMPMDVLDPIRDGAQAAMDDLLRKVADCGVTVRGRIAMERPSSAILQEADRVEADLIVMGTRGLTGLEHFVLGSTADRVIRQSTCPVLTAKAES